MVKNSQKSGKASFESPEKLSENILHTLAFEITDRKPDNNKFIIFI